MMRNINININHIYVNMFLITIWLTMYSSNTQINIKSAYILIMKLSRDEKYEITYLCIFSNKSFNVKLHTIK